MKLSGQVLLIPKQKLRKPCGQDDEADVGFLLFFEK